jgi:hypothetical protein
MRSRDVTAKARRSESCNKDGPPFSEQYCLGVDKPRALVVKAARRRPSPPAKTMTQILRRFLM